MDGLLGFKADATLERIASRLAQKWRKPYSRNYGYMKGKVAITLAQATHRCIRGGTVPASRISVIRPQWEEDAGLHLFQ